MRYLILRLPARRSAGKAGCRRPCRRRAVSLLELLLALGLSVLLMLAVSMAIHLNLRSLDSRRADVEEAQLARAILRMISDDIRSTVQYEVVDFSSVEQMASGLSGSLGGLTGGATGGALTGGSAGGSAGGAAGGSTSGSAGGAAGGSTGGSTGSSTSGSTGGSAGGSAGANTSDIEGSEVPPDVPGLYGNQYELQVDVSRLPRVDEYSTIVDAEGVTRIPSDLKTVSYYVRTTPLDGSTWTPDQDVAPGLNSQGIGLVRREIPRAETRYAMENGNSESIMRRGDLIAPEVTGVSFRYFDGEEWLTEWDSEQSQSLPIAVEIVLTVRSTQAEKIASSAVSNGSSQSTDLVYRLVVRVPSAQLGRSTSGSTTTGSNTNQSGSAQSGSSQSSSGSGGTRP